MPTHPIIFSAESIYALKAGRKTQTRRVVRPNAKRCPYGDVGDLLWVKEAITVERLDGGVWQYRYAADDEGVDMNRWLPWCKRPTKNISPLFMPWEVSRFVLWVTGIRRELLQDITEEDAKAEGADREFEIDAASFVRGVNIDFDKASTYRLGYKHMWDHINRDRGFPWSANPEVWVVEFRVERR